MLLGTNVPIFPGIRDNIAGFVDVFSGGALTRDSTSFDEKAKITCDLKLPDAVLSFRDASAIGSRVSFVMRITSLPA
jgi:hypothetical protein